MRLNIILLASINAWDHMESVQIEIEGLPWLVSLIFDGLIATETADLPYTETQGSRGENLACAALFFILRL